MTLQQAHLNDYEIDDVLIGDVAADLTAHLESCAGCRKRLAAAGAPLASFAAVTMAWSERQSATMPPQSVGTNGSAFGIWNRKLNWALAAVLLAVVGFLLPMATRETPGGTSLAASSDVKDSNVKGAAQQTAAVEPTRVSPHVEATGGVKALPVTERTSNEEVARDNRMLEAIDDELDASVRSPADTFGLSRPEIKSGGRGQSAPAPILD